jgi:hypothetical protein
MLVDRAVGREAEVVADLAVRRRHAALLLELADELENVALSFRQVLHFTPRNEDNMGGKEAKVKRK